MSQSAFYHHCVLPILNDVSAKYIPPLRLPPSLPLCLPPLCPQPVQRPFSEPGIFAMIVNWGTSVLLFIPICHCHLLQTLHEVFLFCMRSFSSPG